MKTIKVLPLGLLRLAAVTAIAGSDGTDDQYADQIYANAAKDAKDAVNVYTASDVDAMLAERDERLAQLQARIEAFSANLKQG